MVSSGIKQVETPELYKLRAARDAGSDEVGAFIDWLQTHGYVIARWEQPIYRVEPSVLVFNQRAPNQPGGEHPCHRTTARRDPAICGAKPKPYMIHGQERTDGGWYGERSRVTTVRDDEVCEVCRTMYDAGEWPERRVVEPRLMPALNSIERLLAEYFEIDLDKVEVERSAILASLRALDRDKDG